MGEDWEEIDGLRDRMRDAATRDYSSGELGDAEYEDVLDRIGQVLSEADVGRLGLVRFHLGREVEAARAMPPARSEPEPYLSALRVGSSFTILGSAKHVLLPGERGLSATILVGDLRVDCRGSDAGRIDLDLMSLLGDIVVEVGADAIIVNDITTVLGEFRDKSCDPAFLDPGKVVRLTGFHLIGDIKIRRG
jgi:hypothetical protein